MAIEKLVTSNLRHMEKCHAKVIRKRYQGIKPINAFKHSRISVKRWGGNEMDYYPIHDFIDSTKELCADSRHRILHTLWGVKNVVVPIFGHTITNSDGKEVDVKDMCERDHLLVDFGGKFIPTLTDFVDAIPAHELTDFENNIEALHQSIPLTPQMSKLMLSPLSVTGQLKSLLITHNSWFINTILPRIFNTEPIFCNFPTNPSTFFNVMNFEAWMDNGLDVPVSAQKLYRLKLKHND